MFQMGERGKKIIQKRRTLTQGADHQVSAFEPHINTTFLALLALSRSSLACSSSAVTTSGRFW